METKQTTTQQQVRQQLLRISDMQSDKTKDRDRAIINLIMYSKVDPKRIRQIIDTEIKDDNDFRESALCLLVSKSDLPVKDALEIIQGIRDKKLCQQAYELFELRNGVSQQQKARLRELKMKKLGISSHEDLFRRVKDKFTGAAARGGGSGGIKHLSSYQQSSVRQKLTRLIHVIMKNDIDALNDMIDKNGVINDIDAQDSNGQTALHHAGMKGFTPLCTRLIELGANPNIQDNGGRTLLMVLIDHERDPTEILKFDAVKEGFNIKDKKGETALHHAGRKRALDTCIHLIELGADPNIQDNDGRTLLIGMLDHNIHPQRILHFDAVKKGFDIKDKEGSTALYAALTSDFRDYIFPYLLKLGADPSLKDNLGYTVLMYAIRYSFSHCFDKLLSFEKKDDRHQQRLDPLNINAINIIPHYILQHFTIKESMSEASWVSLG